MVDFNSFSNAFDKANEQIFTLDERITDLQKIEVPLISSCYGMKFIPETFNACVEIYQEIYFEYENKEIINGGSWLLLGDFNDNVKTEIYKQLSNHLDAEDLQEEIKLTKHYPFRVRDLHSTFFQVDKIKENLNVIKYGLDPLKNTNLDRLTCIYTPNVFYKLHVVKRKKLRNYIYLSTLSFPR